MIELVLNTVWFVLVAGAVTAFFRKNSRRTDQRAFLLSFGALVCAGALLLPSISITDDLHFEAFVVEDSNSTKRVANAGPHAAPVAPVVWLAFVLCGIVLVLPTQLGWCIRVANITSDVSPSFLQPLPGRAPPRLRAA